MNRGLPALLAGMLCGALVTAGCGGAYRSERLDASSPEAAKQSYARVWGKLNAMRRDQLGAAVVMLGYACGNDEARLRAELNGLTPSAIVDKALGQTDSFAAEAMNAPGGGLELNARMERAKAGEWPFE